MDRGYFERLHVEEARRASWRMLDDALQSRSHGDRLRWLRRGVGRALIAVGTRLAADPSQPPVEAVAALPCRS